MVKSIYLFYELFLFFLHVVLLFLFLMIINIEILQWELKRLSCRIEEILNVERRFLLRIENKAQEVLLCEVIIIEM